MNAPSNPLRFKAAATYDAAADHFDDAPLGFWDRHGRQTVALLQPSAGDRVLDVGCGTGASALPAAAAVGPTGSVTGIDVAANMLQLARSKTKAQGLDNTSFALADMTSSGYPDQAFDAVISVFSVFFVADMEGQVSELWRMLRPGGRLAITVWGPKVFEPVSTLLAEEVRRELPDLPPASRPWERLTKPAGLRRLLLDGGTSEPRIEVLPDRQALSEPHEVWSVVMGSGLRAEIDRLTARQQVSVRSRIVQRLASRKVTEVETGGICAIAEKP